MRLDGPGSRSADGGQGGQRERLSQDGGIANERPIGGVERVEPGRDEGVEASPGWPGRRARRSGPVDDPSTASSAPSVDEHPDDLDRVERDAVGALEDAFGDGRLGQARARGRRAAARIAAAGSGSRWSAMKLRRAAPQVGPRVEEVAGGRG